MTTISARDFNRDVSAAKRDAERGPVVITDRGEPAYVLLSIDQYRGLTRSGEDVVDRLSMDDDVDVDVEPLDVGVVDPWRPTSSA